MYRYPYGRKMLVAFAVGACVISTNAVAWGTEGHQVVAALAQAQLTPKAREQIDRLVALEPGQTMESTST